MVVIRLVCRAAFSKRISHSYLKIVVIPSDLSSAR